MPQKSIILEVQGLRGLAVISVLLFHVQLPFIHGGFVGVDIFFVISGFVITRIIKKEVGNNNFNLSAFFIRRFWRILPALFVTVFFTALVFGPLFPLSSNDTFYYSMFSSLFGLSNIYFYFTLDYFSSGIANPLLHTWSLGVEEQFYLFFPLLILGVLNIRQSINHLFFVIFILSFFGAVIVTYTNQSAAFYLPWYRAWEFCTGAIIAWNGIALRKSGVSKSVSLLGLLILLVTILFYKKSFVFPGVGSILPVLGTALLLISLDCSSNINGILRNKFMTFFGDISYSLYLCHWPIVCLVGMFLPITNVFITVSLIVMSVLVGWLMYLLVELPVLRFYKQKSQSLPKLTLGSAMPIFALVLSGFIVLWIAFVNGVWERNPEAGKYLKIENEASLFRLNECFFVTKEDNLDESYNKCLDISTDTKNVLVTGDSLSANITSTFIDTFPNVNFLQASAVNYKPGLESSWTKSAKTLDRLVRSKLWERDVKIDLVVIFAMWQSSDLPMLVENVIALKEKGTKVLVIGPPVDYYTNVPLLQGMSELIDYDLVPHVRRKGRSEMDLEFRSELESVATYYVSVVDAFCQQNQCIHKNDNSGLYTDKVHLTRLGTEVLISDIRKHLNGFLN